MDKNGILSCNATDKRAHEEEKKKTHNNTNTEIEKGGIDYVAHKYIWLLLLVILFFFHSQYRCGNYG